MAARQGQGVLEDQYRPVFFEGDDLLAACRPRGLPIGNLTSQFWSNCYLHPFDVFVKRELGPVPAADQRLPQPYALPRGDQHLGAQTGVVVGDERDGGDGGGLVHDLGRATVQLQVQPPRELEPSCG